MNSKKEPQPKAVDEGWKYRIAVDLTPMLPGAENGGAKIATLILLDEMISMTPDWNWLLFTSQRTHEELSRLERGNARRWLMAPGDNLNMNRDTGLQRSLLPGFDGTGIDLLFCPFTRPMFVEPGVPIVSTVYDLQHLFYPQFFSPADRAERDSNFKKTIEWADQIICISDHVRRTVLANSDYPKDRLTTIHLRLASRLPPPTEESIRKTLDKLGITDKPFLLYPANAWPHKNHRMLFTAWSIYKSKNSTSDLILICTGEPNEKMKELQKEAILMDLGHSILFPGFLSDLEFSSLLSCAHAVIFPSLYEGFGMPIVEAMAIGTAVLSSNLTSLPEVAGDAVLYFDARKPSEIATAIERVMSDHQLVEDLIKKGFQRASEFSDVRKMATEYLHIFEHLLNNNLFCKTKLYGVYEDRWTQHSVTLVYGPSKEPRHVEIGFVLPDWAPNVYVVINESNNIDMPFSVFLEKGRTSIFRKRLPSNSGKIRLLVTPVFQPTVHGLGNDSRILGCFCTGCWIIEGTKRTNLLRDCS